MNGSDYDEPSEPVAFDTRMAQSKMQAVLEEKTALVIAHKQVKGHESYFPPACRFLGRFFVFVTAYLCVTQEKILLEERNTVLSQQVCF